jgi:hypothetical protein
VTLLERMQTGLGDVGEALRRPEEFVVRWRDRGPQARPSRAVFVVLLVNAALGLAAYGLSLDLHHGAAGMALAALKLPLVAGAAWAVALPALYIINTSLGSDLDWSTTALAALTTVSFGALAMLASVPINWFFGLALDYPLVRALVNAVIFAGVGVCMIDVFLRVMKALEPMRSRLYGLVWLALVATIGAELAVLFTLF